MTTTNCTCTGPGWCHALQREMKPARFRECSTRPEFCEMFHAEAHKVAKKWWLEIESGPFVGTYDFPLGFHQYPAPADRFKNNDARFTIPAGKVLIQFDDDSAPDGSLHVGVTLFNPAGEHLASYVLPNVPPRPTALTLPFRGDGPREETFPATVQLTALGANGQPIAA